ncbi:hypothetical protein ACUW84_002614 [Bacillus sp. 153480031-1]
MLRYLFISSPHEVAATFLYRTVKKPTDLTRKGAFLLPETKQKRTDYLTGGSLLKLALQWGIRASILTAIDVYGHLFPNKQKAMAEKLDDII